MHPGSDHNSNVNAYETGRSMQRPPGSRELLIPQSDSMHPDLPLQVRSGASLRCDRTQGSLSGRLEPRRLSASDGVLGVPYHSVPCQHQKLREKADHRDSIRTWA